MTALFPLPVALFSRLARNWRIMDQHGKAALARPKMSAPWALGLVAVALALVVATGLLLDAPVLTMIEGQPAAAKAFFKQLTHLGKADWLLIPSGLLVIVVAAGDWRRVPARSAAAWSQIAAFAMVLFLVVAASGLFTDLLKVVFGRLRPPFIDQTVFEFAPLSFAGYSGYSFPSGHATTSGAVAVLLGCGPRRWRAVGIVAALMVAASRFMIGVHFVSDCVAGFLIGVGISWLIVRAMAWGGFGFRRLASGDIVWRLGVLRRFARSPSALFGLVPALWRAQMGEPGSVVRRP